jgi:phospholipid transport system transporter-binding protein
MAFVPKTAGAATVQVQQAAPDRMTVSGALTFETAKRAYEAGLRVVRSGSNEPLHVDCAGVTESDSAGLAVLIEWLAQGARIDRKVTFANIPTGIRAAAKISDVEFLFA